MNVFKWAIGVFVGILVFIVSAISGYDGDYNNISNNNSSNYDNENASQVHTTSTTTTYPPRVYIPPIPHYW